MISFLRFRGSWPWSTGDFDLFPAGAGQISALIKQIKPVKDIIEKMVS